MYIVNPLERGLNVSKNVSLEEVDRFKTELRNAAWILESQDSNTSNWGILGLFENSRKTAGLRLLQYHGRQGTRMLDVNKLFEEEEEEDEKEKIEFKNEELKRQVEEIKRKTVDTLKGIEKQENKQLKKRRR